MQLCALWSIHTAPYSCVHRAGGHGVCPAAISAGGASDRARQRSSGGTAGGTPSSQPTRAQFFWLKGISMPRPVSWNLRCVPCPANRDMSPQRLWISPLTHRSAGKGRLRPDAAALRGRPGDQRLPPACPLEGEFPIGGPNPCVCSLPCVQFSHSGAAARLRRVARSAHSRRGAAPHTCETGLLLRRLQITHRETMADVTEQTGAAVVTRGIFIPSGQKVPEGERKLGLLIQVGRRRRRAAPPCWPL